MDFIYSMDVAGFMDFIDLMNVIESMNFIDFTNFIELCMPCIRDVMTKDTVKRIPSPESSSVIVSNIRHSPRLGILNNFFIEAV